MSDLTNRARGAIPPAVGNTNRALDTVNTDPEFSMTLEKINNILMNYLINVINPTIVENNNQRSIPVIYGTPERWTTIRKDGVMRDAVNDKLLTPVIMMRRSSVKRGQLINPNNKYMYSTLHTEWNRRNSYDRFAVQNNVRPSQKLTKVMIPDYVDLMYDIVMWTEYQEQMDKLIELFNVENYEYWGERNNFKFRISIDEFAGKNELPPTADRVIRTEFQMKVGAYLIPERVAKNFKPATPNVETYTYKKIIIKETVVNPSENLP
jgi:hypothetical protein